MSSSSQDSGLGTGTEPVEEAGTDVPQGGTGTVGDRDGVADAVGTGPHTSRGPSQVDGPTGPVLGTGEGTGGDAAELLDELRAAIARYVILPGREALDAVTLWVAATHLQPAFQHAPRLAVIGPAKRCGKSRLLDVVTETVHMPVITVNASTAAIFRSVTEEPPTLLVDEADALFGNPKMAEKNEDLRGLLNAGHQRNRPALRISGPEHKPTESPTFAMRPWPESGNCPTRSWTGRS